MSFACLYLIALLSPGTLVDGAGVELVRGHCTGCHSERLITQNRGTRDDWTRTIRWMQRTQNLWQLDPVTEAKILDYLAKNYPPGRASRRPPLHPSLMPSRPGTIPTKTVAIAPQIQPTPTPVPEFSTGCACDHNGGPKPGAYWGAFLVLGCLFRRYAGR